MPLPGETALLTAGVLAGAGRLSLPIVIGVAVKLTTDPGAGGLIGSSHGLTASTMRLPPDEMDAFVTA